jgi:hypothetical protein
MKKLAQLKTFEDACKVLGLDPKTVIPDFSSYPERDRKGMVAHAKLVIIARAANLLANKGKEWAPDWNNEDQWKYYPWFEMGGSSGFRFDDCVVWRSLSFVGSRLCYISREVAEYVGKKFIDLYKDYFLL